MPMPLLVLESPRRYGRLRFEILARTRPKGSLGISGIGAFWPPPTQVLERDTGAGEASAAASPAGSFVGPPDGFKVEFPDGEESRLRYLRGNSQGTGAAQVRTEFRISNRGELPDPTDHIQAGAKKVARLFATKPQAILPFDPEARKIMTGNQVAQSIRATLRADDDPTLSALEANAAGQQGVQAALVSVLDYAGGGGTLDETTGLPLITTEHVQCARRMLDISVGIRAIWRAALDDEGARGFPQLGPPPPPSLPARTLTPL